MDKNLMISWGWSAAKSARAVHTNGIKAFPTELDRAFWDQRGSCKLCGWRAPDPTKRTKSLSAPALLALHADHDHQTGTFRGWLCYNCNVNTLPLVSAGILAPSPGIRAYLSGDALKTPPESPEPQQQLYENAGTPLAPADRQAVALLAGGATYQEVAQVLGGTSEFWYWRMRVARKYGVWRLHKDLTRRGI